MEETIHLRQRLRESGFLATKETKKSTLDILKGIEYSTTSACGRVQVFMSGSGQLRDIVIVDGTLDELGRERVGQVLLTTIRAAEQLIRDALSSMKESRK